MCLLGYKKIWKKIGTIAEILKNANKQNDESITPPQKKKNHNWY